MVGFVFCVVLAAAAPQAPAKKPAKHATVKMDAVVVPGKAKPEVKLVVPRSRHVDEQLGTIDHTPEPPR